MRTEQLLREALHSMADQARTREMTMSRIAAGLPGRPGRPPRRPMVLALAVAVVVLALAVAVPTFLIKRTAVPADQRVPGNWNLIHWVAPPEGWVVRDRYVRTDRESTILGPAGAASDDATGNCSVLVYGQGVFIEPTVDAQPIDINGRPGFAVYEETFEVSTGVYWSYADNAWASATCYEGGTSRGMDIARRTSFGPQPFSAALRLRSLPQGYEALSIMEYTAEGRPASGLELMATNPDAEAGHMFISVSPGAATAPPGLPGYEEDRIAGYPAVLNGREHWLALNLDGYVVRIQAQGGEPEDSTTLWPARRRELLVRVAEDLRLARNPGDPDTWFAAQRAFPR